MSSPYIKKCLQKLPGDCHGFWCIFQCMMKAWQDPKYDIDIMLFFMHIVWALSIWCAMIFPDSFKNYPVEMIEDRGYLNACAFIAFCLGVGHYLSIFLRKPIFRIPIFTISLLWGLSISASVYQIMGPNQESMIYFVLFVYMPGRKIANILRTSFYDFKRECHFNGGKARDEDVRNH